MNYPVLITLTALAIVFMLLERQGVPTTLELHFKGDVKRETGWLAQYGQGVCTALAALLVWRMDKDPRHKDAVLAIIVAVAGTSLIATLIKRVLGRVRPPRANAGQFLCPTWRPA